MKAFEQDPAEKLNYRVALRRDTIADATAAISPSGPTVGTVTKTSTTATAPVSGVVLDTTYTLTFHVIGTSGQEWDRSCTITGVSS